MPEPRSPWPDHVVEGVAQVLGETTSGLTGSEIGRLLAQCGIQDPDPGDTKWRRLCLALIERQRQDRSPNNLIAFIYAAMEPVRYRNDMALFTLRQDALNEVLVSSDTGSTIKRSSFREPRPRLSPRQPSTHGRCAWNWAAEALTTSSCGIARRRFLRVTRSMPPLKRRRASRIASAK